MVCIAVPHVCAQGLHNHPKDHPTDGYWCFDCHEFEDYPPNWRWIKTQIVLKDWHAAELGLAPGAVIPVPAAPYDTINHQEADYRTPIQPDNSGPCQVCHTKTDYYKWNEPGLTHPTEDCLGCHSHWQVEIFEGEFIGPQAHETHLATYEDPKGPAISDDDTPPGSESCEYCHDPNDYNLFQDGLPLETTTVCDPCHGPRGAFDGVGKSCREEDSDYPGCLSDPDYPEWVAYGAKFNWENGVYEESGDALKTGKKKWCVGCHDRRLDNPNTTTSDAQIRGVFAPGVAGDNGEYGDSTSYGFYYNGHGKPWPNRPGLEIHCDGCHDYTVINGDTRTFTHIDGDPRTYDALADPNNYQAGYRLKLGMIIPRTGYEPLDVSFPLCMDACHNLAPEPPHQSVFTPINYLLTNFRDRSEGVQEHLRHLTEVGESRKWDSDWDGTVTDSLFSCPACHNVHGSPTVVMTRHGELISTPGDVDKVPAMDYRWYLEGGITETFDLNESRVIHLDQLGIRNTICATCHKDDGYYYRVPGGTAAIAELIDTPYIWVSDLNDKPRLSCFNPGEDIRYHVDFYATGQFDIPQWWIQTFYPSGAWSTNWQVPMTFGTYVTRGEHNFHYDTTIPAYANTAEAHFRIDMKIAPGPAGPVLHQRVRQIDFDIDPQCPESPLP
jgi:hypothetical protein